MTQRKESASFERKAMRLEDELFRIEEGFWLAGEEHFMEHVDASCLLAFPQAGPMHGLFSRERIAQSATPPNRWRNLRIADRHMLQPTNEVAVISYRADVLRQNGQPYAAFVSSAYVRRTDGWKLTFHQHSPV
ncbi:MAG TPA: hypothetical protein VG758_01380 [Hyphomicrobiaceae bacterium]|jgi:hypothetical protein|nr:hypothetical protein [Hyphomicrobiaceae bacterium]